MPPPPPDRSARAWRARWRRDSRRSCARGTGVPPSAGWRALRRAGPTPRARVWSASRRPSGPSEPPSRRASAGTPPPRRRRGRRRGLRRPASAPRASAIAASGSDAPIARASSNRDRHASSGSSRPPNASSARSRCGTAPSAVARRDERAPERALTARHDHVAARACAQLREPPRPSSAPPRARPARSPPRSTTPAASPTPRYSSPTLRRRRRRIDAAGTSSPRARWSAAVAYVVAA